MVLLYSSFHLFYLIYLLFMKQTQQLAVEVKYTQQMDLLAYKTIVIVMPMWIILIPLYFAMLETDFHVLKVFYLYYYCSFKFNNI